VAALWPVTAPDRGDSDQPTVVASSPTRVVVAHGDVLIVYDHGGRKVGRASLPGSPASGLFLARDRVYAVVAGKVSGGACD